MNKLHIVMPDTLYVGKYYKLYALPSYGALEVYDYSFTGDCAELVATNTIKITGTGEITVAATGEIGTASKTIRCEEYPVIERKTIEYVYDNAENFKAFIEGLTEPTEVRFMEDADIVIDDTINVPYGVVLNFNWKNIKLGANEIEARNTFVFDNDFCGIKNLKLYSNYPDWSLHTNSDKYLQAHTMFAIRGSFFEMENFLCVNKQNAGISVARWGSLTGSYYTKKNTWLEGNIANGYVDTEGNIATDENAWYSTEFVNLPDKGNGYFSVGYFGNFLQHTAKTYGIALYDADGNFLEARYGLQFYRGYMRPEGATQCKLMLWGLEEPEVIKVGQAGGMDWNYYLYVTGTDNTREILFKNCRSMNNESGIIDFIGDLQEVNIIECKAESGKTNGWAIDFEDGWMGMKDVIIKSCLFMGKPVFHSVQGLTVMNTFSPTFYITSWANGVVLERCAKSYNQNSYYLDTEKITSPVIFKDYKSCNDKQYDEQYARYEGFEVDATLQYVAMNFKN